MEQPQCAAEDADVREAVNKAAEEMRENGRILIRVSGTEPVLRVMAEGSNEQICQKYMNRIAQVLLDKNYI
jgi:phosphoglucosamine mutase